MTAVKFKEYSLWCVYVYTTDVVVEEQEFAESNNAGGGDGFTSASRVPDDGFMMIPDGIDDELPFV